MLELLTRHPHPHIVGYHGVRVRRNHITGLVLDRHRRNLTEHVDQGLSLDVEAFLSALGSALDHLHSLGLVHNDLNPGNVMVGADGMPILIDFGSCCSFGKRLLSGGTAGWVDTTSIWSAEKHDTDAFAKIREWLKRARSQ